MNENNPLFAVAEIQPESRPDQTPRSYYLARTLDHFTFYQQVNRIVKPTDKILLFQEIRGYYLDGRYQWGDPLNQNIIAYDHLSDSAALEQRLRAEGISYVLTHPGNAVYAPDARYYSTHVLALMQGVLAAHGDCVLAQDGLALFRLRSNVN